MTERDNESRLGLNLPEQVQQEEVPVDTRSGLDFVMPTELVSLPSEGKLYPLGHPLRDKKELEIRFMTAKEEDILTNQSFLKKGVAIDKLLESIVINKRVKLDDLMIGDKNALILATRKSGYGPKYETMITCPKCETKGKYVFDLDAVSNKQQEIPEGVDSTDRGTFKFVLPRTKCSVEVRAIFGKDEKILKEIKDKASTAQMKLFIVSVDDKTEQKTIDSFVDRMPASDARFLRDTYKKLIPDVDMTQKFECSSCEHEEVLEIPLTTDFFWPK